MTFWYSQVLSDLEEILNIIFNFVKVTPGCGLCQDSLPPDENITIVGLPDFVNNDFKIAFYAKEAQRYLCFNEHWKLVGMHKTKELHETCYFNETIVHGYFVFRSVVNLQRRIGFTPRGKAVGPKRNVNDACYMFTKIPTDQFLHQLATFLPRSSIATTTKPQSSQQGTMNNTNIYGDLNLNIESSHEKGGKQFENLQQQHLSRDNDQRLNGIQNKYVNEKEFDHRDHTQDYSKNLDLIKVKKSYSKLHMGLNNFTKERKQRLHFLNSPRQKQHQVRHHHNNPHMLARRKHHEQKEKHKHCHLVNSSPNVSTLSITSRKRTAAAFSSTAPTLMKSTFNKKTSSYSQYFRIATTVGVNISSVTSITTLNRRKDRRRKVHKVRANHTEGPVALDMQNEPHHMTPSKSKPISRYAAPLPTVSPQQSFSNLKEINQNPEVKKKRTFTGETQMKSYITREKEYSTTESVSTWEKLSSTILTTITEEVKLSSSTSPYFSNRSSSFKEDSVLDITNATAFNKHEPNKIAATSMEQYFSHRTTFDRVMLTTSRILTAQQLNKTDGEKGKNVTQSNFLSIPKAILPSISFTSGLWSVNGSLESNASRWHEMSTKIQKVKANDMSISVKNDIPENGAKLQENSSLVSIPFKDEHDEVRLSPCNIPKSVQEDEHDRMVTVQFPKIQNRAEKPENDVEKKKKKISLTILSTTPRAVVTTTKLKPALISATLTLLSPENSSVTSIDKNDSANKTNNSSINNSTNDNRLPLFSLMPTAMTTPRMSLRSLIINKASKNFSQKVIATPFHQLTYVRNQAGEIDIDNIDNINIYPHLLDDNGGSKVAILKQDIGNDGQRTLITAYLPTLATATLPESIRIAKIKINRERKRRMHLHSIDVYT
ncbi:rho GTPase-activating protein gacF isoform X4 [Glossina fuscipes]|uniref:Rho GTPase-activating protein gacF isoform X4 n=1 Tax=Glossina fuscipes TaxID=7396 RepID=A0A9C6DVT8_9MUSC|nr:rho GTPase-activating protein gacF isoform X4 [Glossina fuscipes]